MKSFLNAKDKIEVKLASLFSKHLPQASREAAVDCEVETDLCLIVPNALQREARIYSVSKGNCSECLSKVKNSDVFQFGHLFEEFKSNPGRELRNGESCY